MFWWDCCGFGTKKKSDTVQLIVYFGLINVRVGFAKKISLCFTWNIYSDVPNYLSSSELE